MHDTVAAANASSRWSRPENMMASKLRDAIAFSSSSAKIPQIGAFPDHRGVAAYSHLQDFGGDSDKSLCFPTTISFVYFLPPRAVIHCESEV
jgi:hypothetical protein